MTRMPCHLLFRRHHHVVFHKIHDPLLYFLVLFDEYKYESTTTIIIIPYNVRRRMCRIQYIPGNDHSRNIYCHHEWNEEEETKKNKKFTMRMSFGIQRHISFFSGRWFLGANGPLPSKNWLVASLKYIIIVSVTLMSLNDDDDDEALSIVTLTSWWYNDKTFIFGDVVGICEACRIWDKFEIIIIAKDGIDDVFHFVVVSWHSNVDVVIVGDESMLLSCYSMNHGGGIGGQWYIFLKLFVDDDDDDEDDNKKTMMSLQWNGGWFPLCLSLCNNPAMRNILIKML